ncbi:hypothetical protein CAL7716_107690 (plasmid) [Calothrix sp. PCC 7716]|nr:hypothetical protein CAL7716_107690 [Calothrix sp. PCC 7716]
MICKHCNFEHKLNVVVDRRTKRKALRTGCCDIFIRWCPAPEDLLRLPNLTPDERDFLNSVANLDWFTSRVATNLIEIEEKGKKGVTA